MNLSSLFIVIWFLFVCLTDNLFELVCGCFKGLTCRGLSVVRVSSLYSRDPSLSAPVERFRGQLRYGGGINFIITDSDPVAKLSLYRATLRIDLGAKLSIWYP